MCGKTRACRRWWGAWWLGVEGAGQPIRKQKTKWSSLANGTAAFDIIHTTVADLLHKHAEALITITGLITPLWTPVCPLCSNMWTAKHGTINLLPLSGSDHTLVQLAPQYVPAASCCHQVCKEVEAGSQRGSAELLEVSKECENASTAYSLHVRVKDTRFQRCDKRFPAKMSQAITPPKCLPNQKKSWKECTEMSEEGIKVNPYDKGGEVPKDNCCLDIEDTVYKSQVLDSLQLSVAKRTAGFHTQQSNKLFS